MAVDKPTQDDEGSKQEENRMDEYRNVKGICKLTGGRKEIRIRVRYTQGASGAKKVGFECGDKEKCPYSESRGENACPIMDGYDC